jgi:hypothetical protein
MVVIALILLSLGVALFIMLSDTRRNDNFKQLEQRNAPPERDGGGLEFGGDGDGGGD